MAYSPIQKAIDEAVKGRLAQETKRASRKLNRMAKQVRAVKLAFKAQQKILKGLDTKIDRIKLNMNGNGRGGAGQGATTLTTNGKIIRREVVDPATVKAFREQLSMSREQFARLLGVHHGTIYGWEVGSFHPIGATAEKFRVVEKLGVKGVMKRLLAGWTAPKKLGRPFTKKRVFSKAGRAAVVANAAKARAARAAKRAAEQGETRLPKAARKAKGRPRKTAEKPVEKVVEAAV
jgi:DNA-binding transcriptional regulator YiaG